MNLQDDIHNPTTPTPAQARAEIVDSTLHAAWDSYGAGTITADGLREAVYSALFKMRFRRRPTLERLHDIAFQILWTPEETGRAAQSECIWDFERRKPRKNAKQGESFAEFVRRLATNGYDALQREEWEEDKRKLQTEHWIDGDDSPALAVSPDNPTAIPLPPRDGAPLLANAALDDPELRAALRPAEQRYRQRHPAIAKYHLCGARSASEVESLIRKNGEPSHVTGRRAIGKHMEAFERDLVNITLDCLRETGESAGLDWDGELEQALAKLGLSKSKSKGRIKPAHTRRTPVPEDEWETTGAELVAETDDDDAEEDIPSWAWHSSLAVPITFADLTPDHRFQWTWNLMLAEDERSSVGKDTGTVASSEKEEAVVA